MKLRSALSAAGLALAAVPAIAGPPYITDDPAPTDVGRWEIYAFSGGDGRRSTIDGDTGLDLNYGPAKDIQLTATLPLSFSHAPHERWREGTGDAELAVKYRFLDDEKTGVSAALFPRVILPTSSIDSGERVRLLLPIWLEKDFAGGTSLFGGGGYELDPGRGNRNFWQAGIALTHDLDPHVSIGGEVTRQGADTTGTTAQTSAGLGTIVKLSKTYALLLSGGPTWADHRTGYHVYGALGLFF